MRGIKPLKWDHDPDYRYLNSGLYLHEWAWEFLRRNEDYIKDWERWNLAKKKTTSDHYFKARSNASFKYGLIQPYDPVDSGLVHGGIVWSDSTSVFIVEELPVGSAGEDGRWPGYPEAAAIQFHFDKPIDAQLEWAKKILDDAARWVRDEEGIAIRRPSIRPQLARFPIYVRFLDGSDTGATAAEMGRKFLDGFDPSSAGRKTLKQAKKMALEGYRELLLYPNRSGPR